MINDAVNQTLSRTIITSLTAWLVVVILYVFGGEGLHGFAFSLVVGFLSGTYSTIYIATPILIDWDRKARQAGQERGLVGGDDVDPRSGRFRLQKTKPPANLAGGFVLWTRVGLLGSLTGRPPRRMNDHL